MLNETKHNLNILSNIDGNTYLRADDNKIFVDDSWVSYVRHYNPEITIIIRTTLNNTLTYLELNLSRINEIQKEYIERLSLLKKALESVNKLSTIKGYESLSKVEEDIRNSLKILETKLEENAKKESELNENNKNNEINESNENEEEVQTESENEDDESQPKPIYKRIITRIQHEFIRLVNTISSFIRIFF
jgi:hypothetical protein